MPRLPDVPNVVKAQLQWQDAAGNPLYNNLFLQYEGGPPNASEALSLASSIFTAAAFLLTQANEQVVLTGCRVTDLSADDTGDALHSGSTAGSLHGDELPASAAALINFTIGRRYRGGKPRNYFPLGDNGNMADPRTWAGGFVTNVEAAWSSFIGAVLGTVAGSTTITAHVNVSYYSGSTGSIVDGGNRGKTTPTRRETPLVNDIIGFSMAPRIASQRRRLGRS
jgi:hypothetical protein